MTAPQHLPSAGDMTQAPQRGGDTTRCANPECRHLDVMHAFNTKNTVRKACSVHEGARNTPCACTTYTLPESETPRD